ncbi:hypothetical protein M404DRAFT_26387 [Pisolithus tinctorius Marx 270]|uniref:Uncharacterized protein n=1 Tax=Pisolithus tinctorius Marx 270 TaxID=870435 RepID=A0A0C3K3R0_PISTI|nr:hypothetical protein M404DRAFT_26387 [Pisolithus tinctorius Marx 270]
MLLHPWTIFWSSPDLSGPSWPPCCPEPALKHTSGPGGTPLALPGHSQPAFCLNPAPDCNSGPLKHGFQLSLSLETPVQLV